MEHEYEKQYNDENLSLQQTLSRQRTSLTRTDSMFETASRQTSRVLSTIRSRDPRQNAPFTHPLAHAKTGDDVIVDFDGPDDPYKPLNWPFRKKCITTLLYGLTTMGMLLFAVPEYVFMYDFNMSCGLTFIFFLNYRCYVGFRDVS